MGTDGLAADKEPAEARDGGGLSLGGLSVMDAAASAADVSDDSGDDEEAAGSVFTWP